MGRRHGKPDCQPVIVLYEQVLPVAGMYELVQVYTNRHQGNSSFPLFPWMNGSLPHIAPANVWGSYARRPYKIQLLQLQICETATPKDNVICLMIHGFQCDGMLEPRVTPPRMTQQDVKM